jgi:hypothetical protein
LRRRRRFVGCRSASPLRRQLIVIIAFIMVAVIGVKIDFAILFADLIRKSD